MAKEERKQEGTGRGNGDAYDGGRTEPSLKCQNENVKSQCQLSVVSPENAVMTEVLLL